MSLIALLFPELGLNIALAACISGQRAFYDQEAYNVLSRALESGETVISEPLATIVVNYACFHNRHLCAVFFFYLYLLYKIRTFGLILTPHRQAPTIDRPRRRREGKRVFMDSARHKVFKMIMASFMDLRLSRLLCASKIFVLV